MVVEWRAARPGDVPDDLDLEPEFVALSNGTVVGCTQNTWWDEADGTRLYLLLGWVDPAYRRRGYGREMLAWQERRAREQAAADPVGRPVFGGNADEGQDDVRALLLAAGYRVAFTRVHLTKELDAAPAPAVPAGVELRAAGDADHRAVFEANAEVFGDRSLGYVEDTFEEFEHEAAEQYPDHDLWTLAYDGDRLAGWVISGIQPDGTADTPWVGVRPEYRRRGLASTLLRVNHRHLFDRGVRTAGLWTVLENPTGSVALYQSLGYRITTRQPRYRKPF